MDILLYIVGMIAFIGGGVNMLDGNGTYGGLAVTTGLMCFIGGRVIDLLESTRDAIQQAAYGAKPGKVYQTPDGIVIQCWHCGTSCPVPESGRAYRCDKCGRAVGIIR